MREEDGSGVCTAACVADAHPAHLETVIQEIGGHNADLVDMWMVLHQEVVRIAGHRCVCVVGLAEADVAAEVLHLETGKGPEVDTAVARRGAYEAAVLGGVARSGMVDHCRAGWRTAGTSAGEVLTVALSEAAGTPMQRAAAGWSSTVAAQ
jgi:hypothetical protein